MININKRVFFLIGSLIHAASVMAQTPLYKKADKYFENFQFASAVEKYREIIAVEPTSMHAMERLAICYEKLNDPANAEKWLKKICEQPEASEADLKLYAQVLAENGKYDASAEWYQRYLQKTSDHHAAQTLSTYKTFDVFFSDSSFYKVNPLEMNSAESDFSPIFYHDGLLFCSARKEKKKTTYAWDNSAFIDLYYWRDGQSPSNFGKPVNSPLHEGPATFTANGDTLFFTRNDEATMEKHRNGKAIVRLKIYYTVLKNGVWQKEQSLPVNNADFSAGHPAAASGGRLYFVSDKPGGFGGTDLYYIRFVNGVWTESVNLGPEVNTSGNEMFPFIDSNGDLYFASNTHAGMGGLDIFVSRNENGKFGTPKNLGHPVNSSRDDFGFILKGDKGYFSSNRGDDPKDDNIFEVNINKMKSVTIQAVDEQGSSLGDFSLSISSNGTAEHHNVSSVLTTTLHGEGAYVITATKNGYEAQSLDLRADDVKRLNKSAHLTLTLSRSRIRIVFEVQSNEGTKLPDGLIEIKDEATGQTVLVGTDEKGNRYADLLTTGAYLVKASRKDYKEASVQLGNERIGQTGNGGVFVVTLVPNTALFDKNEVGQTIELEIKYDVNKATIRPDAARELDKLVAFMKKNPGVKVELGSHTDTRGSEEANLKLSQRRAESAVRYLVAKGVNPKRLIPIGYGEDDLKVRDAVTEEDHQHNRRTTVKIVSLQ